MKLGALKTMPQVFASDIDDCIDFIDRLTQNKKAVFTNNFDAEIISYLQRCVNAAKGKDISKCAKNILDYKVRLNERTATAKVTIITSKSALTEVKTFLKLALDTTGQFKDLRGKDASLICDGSTYEYELELELSEGISRRGGAIIGDGILRVVVLNKLLAEFC